MGLNKEDDTLTGTMVQKHSMQSLNLQVTDAFNKIYKKHISKQ